MKMSGKGSSVSTSRNVLFSRGLVGALGPSKERAAGVEAVANGHIHVQLHETLPLISPSPCWGTTHREGLGYESEADSPRLPCGFVAAVFLGNRGLLHATRRSEASETSLCGRGTVWSRLGQQQKATQTEIGLLVRSLLFAAGVFSDGTSSIRTLSGTGADPNGHLAMAEYRIQSQLRVSNHRWHGVFLSVLL